MRELEHIYSYLKDKLLPKYKVSKNVLHNISDYGNINVPIEVQLDGHDVLAVECVKDKKADLARVLDNFDALDDFIPPYFVITYEEKYYLIKNYKNLSPKVSDYIYIVESGKEDFFNTQLDNKHEITLANIVKLIKDYNYSSYGKISYDQLRVFFLKKCPKKIRSNVFNFLENIKTVNPEDVICGNTYRFWLKAEYEDKLFLELLSGAPSRLFRYTSVSAFNRILNQREVSMAPLYIMNDKTENNYANGYLSNKLRGCDVDCHHAKFANTISDAISVFINSFSESDDDLPMWFMYGGEAKGVELIEDFNYSGDEFHLARVSYSNKDGSNVILNYIASLLKGKIAGRAFCLSRWHIWQHFFKPYSFHNEKEVRLLFIYYQECEQINAKQGKRKWINDTDKHFPIVSFPLNEKDSNKYLNYPCSIQEIKLGPLFPKKEEARTILKEQLEEINNSNVLISISRIKELQ